MATLVPYYRVSSQKQGRSGLGLAGQEEAVLRYAQQIGATVKGRYIEVESGRDNDRPQLANALSHARRIKGTLCVAKLDRLSRDVEFLARVMNSGTEFTACDNPSANRLTLHILSAVAEAEAAAISSRTVAALAAAKARGTLLGSARPGHWEGREEARLNGLEKAREVSVKVRQEKAREAYTDLLPAIQGMKAEGLSLRAIAAKLNEEGHTTRRGCPWNPMQVRAVLLASERAE